MDPFIPKNDFIVYLVTNPKSRKVTEIKKDSRAVLTFQNMNGYVTIKGTVSLIYNLNEKNKFCYKATSFATTRLIAAKLGIHESRYTVCFQSRLDKKWLTPFSDKVVEEWGKKGAKNLLVFSPAFVADCLETIIEIGTEYQEIFEKHGGKKVQLVPSSNTHPLFINGLVQLIKERI